jgi:Spy/CpxP family protein refolding chaperone
MQRSKQQAVMFLLGAVLVGGALGFTADRVMVRESGDRPSDKTFRQNFYEQLELTAAQRASVDSILDDRHRQINAVFQPLRPKLDSIKENARAQIRRVLTSEQRDRFEAFLVQQQRTDSSGGSKK